MQAATSVEAGVDDNSLAIVVFAQYVRIDGTETIVAHRLYVDISETAVGPFIYIGRTLFHPAGIEQGAEHAVAYRDYNFFPAFFGLRIVQ